MLERVQNQAAGVLQGDVLVVTILAKEIRDAEPAYSLRDEIISLIDKFHPNHIVFDLAEVRFIGSIGLLAFLGARRHFGNGRMILCNVTEAIQSMLVACRLVSNQSSPFELGSTVESTLGGLSGIGPKSNKLGN